MLFIDYIHTTTAKDCAIYLVHYCSCHARETRVRAQTPSHVQAHVDTLTIAADGETDPDMCVRWESD